MLLSRYNTVIPSGTGQLLYNAFSGGFCRLNDTGRKVLDQLLQGVTPEKMNGEEASIARELIAGGIVVEDHDVELAQLRHEINLDRYNPYAMTLVLLPTRACNLRCQYCYQGSDKPTDKMSPEVIDTIIRYVESLPGWTGRLDITWYGGEPLLAFDVIKSLGGRLSELTFERGMELFQGIISNGLLLDEPTAKALSELGVTFAQVTLDGQGEDHDRKRPTYDGQPSYDTVRDNLLVASRYLRIAVRINTDLDNSERLHRLLDDLEPIKERITVYLGQVQPLTAACASVSRSCLNRREFSQVQLGFSRIAVARGFKTEVYPMLRRAYCMAIRPNGWLIDPDGLVYKCFNDVGIEERSCGYLGGELRNKRYYLNLLSWDPTSLSTCTSCSLLPLCLGGCPHNRMQSGALEHCSTWKYNLESMLRLYMDTRAAQQDQ